MKQGLKIWVFTCIGYFFLNVFYWLLVLTPLRYSLGLKDDYMILINPLLLKCVDGCSTFVILTIDVIAALTIGSVLATIISLFFRKIRSNYLVMASIILF